MNVPVVGRHRGAVFQPVDILGSRRQESATVAQLTAAEDVLLADDDLVVPQHLQQLVLDAIVAHVVAVSGWQEFAILEDVE